MIKVPLALLVLALAVPARAVEPYELRNTGAGFLALETAGTLVVFAAYSIAAGDTPQRCSWCRPGGFDEGVRDALRSGDPETPAIASHVLSVGVIPVAGIAALVLPALDAGRGSVAARDGWIMVNAFLLSTGLTDGTKKLVARQRPAFRHGVEGATEASDQPGEENLSFFSGDTAWAFSLASSAATLSYLHGYESAPFVALGGGALATTAGLLRIAADMHWLTDVIAGAAVGTAVGVGLPVLLHGRESPADLRITPIAGGATGAVVSGTF